MENENKKKKTTSTNKTNKTTTKKTSTSSSTKKASSSSSVKKTSSSSSAKKTSKKAPSKTTTKKPATKKVEKVEVEEVKKDVKPKKETNDFLEDARRVGEVASNLHAVVREYFKGKKSKEALFNMFGDNFNIEAIEKLIPGL